MTILKKPPSSSTDWEGGMTSEQYPDLDTLSLEENVDEIADSLLSHPPLWNDDVISNDVAAAKDDADIYASEEDDDDDLGEILLSKRERLKRAWNKSEDMVVETAVETDDEASIDADAEELSQESSSHDILDMGVDTFAEAAVDMDEEESAVDVVDEDELSNNHDISIIEEERQEIVSEYTLDKESEEIPNIATAILDEENVINVVDEEDLPEKLTSEMTTDSFDLSLKDFEDDNESESRSLSPTHSIEEDYERIKMTKSESNDVNDIGVPRNNLIVEADDEVIDGLDSSDAATLHDETNEPTLVKNKSQDDPSLLDDAEIEEPQSFSALSTERNKSDDIAEPTIIDLPSPLNAILSTATSFLSPKPPLSPPTASTIMNSDAVTSNLVEINAQLQKTSKSQREDLGRLRRKINELERQLIRAKREKVAQIEDEVNARVEVMKKDCEQQVTDANEAVLRLEKELNKLKVDFDDSIQKLKQTEEAKERVAAEYGFVTKAYTKVKHALDSQQKEWDEKIETLENQLDHYQKEARQWKEECANKANLLESSTSRIVQMQNTIEGLQSVIQTKEDEIQRIVSAKAKEVELKLSQAKRELRDEYEELLSKKSKKIGEVRRALRSANEKRRRMEHVARRDTAEAVNEMHSKMMAEIDALNVVLAERENELVALREEAANAERVVEDRERLLAEMM